MVGGSEMVLSSTRSSNPLDNNKLAITVDIEDWYHIPSVCGSPFSVYRDVDEFFEKWTEKYDYLSEPRMRVLTLFEKCNIRAAFFVVADMIQHYPGLVESIADHGHEIACHGLHHACKIDPKTKKPLLSQSEFEKRTKQAKTMLEKVSGENVIGYRAPNALVGGWMLDSLENIGFKYDSSVCVNSIYNKTDSDLAGVSSAPYFPQKNSLRPAERRDIIELPWAYYDMGFKIPTSGGPMLRFLGANILLSGLLQSLRRGTTVLYFHPIDISLEKFPEIGTGRPFYWLFKGRIIENRIKYILNRLTEKGVSVGPIYNCDNAWI